MRPFLLAKPTQREAKTMMIDTESPEFKEKYMAIVDHEKATEGLVNKNKELLGKQKKLKEQLDAFDDMTPDEVRGKLTQLDDLIKTGAENEENYKRLLKEQTDNLNKQITKLTKENAEIDGQFKNMLVENNLTKSLVDAGVAKSFIPAVTAMLQPKITIENDEGSRSLKINGEGVQDYIKTWSQSDEGKPFIAAPGNSGGGAPGANGRNTGMSNPWAKDTRNLTEQGRILKENPQLAESLKAAAQA